MLRNKSRIPLALLIIVLFLSSSSINAKNNVASQSSKYFTEYDPNVWFSSELQGKSLKFSPLKNGTNIPLHSLIVMPSKNEEGFLSIEFPRNLVEDKFIRDMFFGEDKNILKIHPFSENGIEPILMKDKLIINLYSGVILHLRNDMEYFPEYKTFKNNKVIGTIIKVKGKVFYSSDTQLIQQKLNHVFVQWIAPSSDTKLGAKIYKQPDGSYVVLMPKEDATDLPPKYHPRILDKDKM